MTPSLQSWLVRAAGVTGALVCIYTLHVIVDNMLVEYAQRIVMLMGINVILAVGLNLINGTTGQFSIGHAGFMAVGAYTAAYCGTQVGPWVTAVLGPGPITDAVVFNLALGVAAACAGVVGLFVGMPSLRLRGDYLAVVTLGFGEIIRIIFNNTQALGAATGYFGDDPSGLPAYTSTFWVYAWATAVIAAIGNLTFSQTGRLLTAIREDEVAAEAMAVPVTRMKVLAFTLSAASAGIAGGLFAHMQAGIRPEDFRFDKSIDMVVMVIVGGLGSISGAALGGIFVAVTLELMRDFAQYRLVLYSLLLVGIVLLRPQGLMGRRELPEVVRALFRRVGTRST